MADAKGIIWKGSKYEFVAPETLTGYDKSEVVDEKIAAAVTGLTSGDKVDEKIDDALDGYYDKNEITKMFNNYTGPSGMAVPEDDDGKFYAKIEKTKEGEPTSVVNVEYLESRLANIGGGGSGGSVDLSNYYTKEETYNRVETNNAIDAAINNVAGIKIASGSYNSGDWEYQDEDYINGTLIINTGFKPKKVEFQYQNGGAGLVYYTYLFSHGVFDLTDTGFKVTKDEMHSTAEGLYPDWTEVTNVYWVAIG